MEVARRRQIQALLQEDLSRRVVQQIGAAANLGDPLVRVIDDDRQLISGQPAFSL